MKPKILIACICIISMLFSATPDYSKAPEAEQEQTAIVTFTIDDSYKDAITVVKPLFDKYQIKGSIGVVQSLVQYATKGRYPWYLTEADLLEFHNSGWELLSHGTDLARTSDGKLMFREAISDQLVSSEGYTVEQEIKDSKTYINNLIGEDVVTGFVIPDLYMLDEYTPMIASEYTYALGMGSTNPEYAHDRTKVSYMSLVANQTDAEAQNVANSMIEKIDQAIAKKSELNIYFHVTDTYIKEIYWSSYDCNEKALDLILQYLAQKRDTGELQIKLPGEVYGQSKTDSIPTPTASPVITATSSPSTKPTITPTTNVATATPTVIPATTIPSPVATLGPESLSYFTPEAIPDETYTGNPIKPIIIMSHTDASGKCTILPSSNYKVSYANNTKVGTAAVTITAIGSCTGTQTTHFYIIPNTVKKLSTKITSKGNVYLTWKKNPGNVTGYKIWKYNESTKKYTALGTTKKLQYKVQKQKGKKCVYAVKAYKKIGNVTKYSPSYKKIQIYYN